MTIKTINEELTVCKVADYEGIDLSVPYVFTGSTDEEKSLVCPTRLVPDNTVERDDGWRGFRIEGTLDFSLIGIFAEISRILADGRIGIFAISTFNTDYILTKSENFERAIALLMISSDKPSTPSLPSFEGDDLRFSLPKTSGM